MNYSVFNLNKKLSPTNNNIKSILLLGGSGSVGKQTFALCIQHPNKYKIKAIISGKNITETIKQGLQAEPQYIVMTDENSAIAVSEALKHLKTKVLYGHNAQIEIISQGYDVGITAIPGLVGLDLTLHTIKHCQIVAFANKETIIYAGDLMLEYADKHNTCIIPIDSEHNSIFQLLNNSDNSRIKNITLTASGGPLLNKQLSDIYNTSVEEVLKHPTWNMGQKITVDSATLFNKALEVVEASYLFGLPIDNIKAVIHPESIVHGIAHLNDGSLLMHASCPDMMIPIAYALAWPYNSLIYKPLDLTIVQQLNFIEVEYERYPIFKLAINAAKEGVQSRIIMNYANEIAVRLFLNRQIKFGEIYKIVQFALDKLIFQQPEIDQSDYISSVRNICSIVEKIILYDYAL